MKHARTIACLVILLSGLCLPSAHAAPAHSLYDYHAALIDQDGKPVGLDIFRGHPVVVAMFYASCKYSCPLLLSALTHLESQLDATHRADVRVLLISFDSANDTPEILCALANDRHLDLARWKLTRGDASTVRDIAALLNVSYRAIPGGGFNHTSLLTLLSDTGDIVHSEEGLTNAADSIVGLLQPRKALP